MKTLIVTGASRGIGLEICKQAAIKGHQVIALSRNIKPLLGIENIHPKLLLRILLKKLVNHFLKLMH